MNHSELIIYCVAIEGERPPVRIYVGLDDLAAHMSNDQVRNGYDHYIYYVVRETTEGIFDDEHEVVTIFSDNAPIAHIYIDPDAKECGFTGCGREPCDIRCNPTPEALSDSP